MSPDSKRKAGIALAIILIVALVGSLSRREAAHGPTVAEKARPDRHDQSAPGGVTFDFYLMAMTVLPAFCADGNESRRQCAHGNHRVLVIHGLWPERMQPRTYPHDCPAPALDLEPALAAELADFMPGMDDGLHEHEWREHGGCSGLDDDDYFRRALELARGVDAALGAKLTTLAGRETTAGELREVADLFSPGLGRTLTFHCRTLRDAQSPRPYLIEVRQCVDNDGPGGAPGTALACAMMKRRDQGCGASFLIAGAEAR